MRKNHELRIDTKKLLTLSIAAIFLMSAITVISTPKAFADPPNVVPAGSGPGSIFLTLHRIPSNFWDPCFAWTCLNLNSTGGAQTFRGPGTWMFFVVYNSAGVEIANGYANEDGTTITGLNIGETYRVVPQDCGNTTATPTCDAGPEVRPHDVFFNNWSDCTNPESSVQERPFTIQSAATISAAGFYRYYPIGPTPDHQLSCFAGVVGKAPTHTASGPASRHITVDIADVYSALNMKQAIINTIRSDSDGGITQVASTNASIPTTLSAKMIPSINLSGKPLGAYGTVVNYNSLYDIQNSDSDGLIAAMNAAPVLGIDWNSLSDMQKAYLTLTLQYNAPTPDMIPSTNLSGVPLGHGGQKVIYNSLYDVQNADSDGIIKAMVAADEVGIDWNSLSDMQKAYLALVLDYGLPSSQA